MESLTKHLSWSPRRVAFMVVLAAAMALTSVSAAHAAQLRGADLHPMASDQSEAILSQEFNMLQQAGATSVRFDIFWTSVEWSGKGDYDQPTLTYLDWVFAQAHAHGLKVILDVWSTPCWASSAPVTMTQGCSSGWWNQPVRLYPPVNPQDYADFCAFAAQRWGPDLAALELWNEPQGSQFLISSDPAGDYARLVRAAYPAVKAVAPNLPVIMSMAGTSSGWLQQLYADGVKGDYDGIAVHPYGQPTLNGLKALHAFQLQNGDRTPLWVTEVGWSTAQMSQATAATEMSSVMTQLAALPYVAAVEVYNLRDTGANSGDRESNFGLLNPDLTPKVGWRAFEGTLAALRRPRRHPVGVSASLNRHGMGRLGPREIRFGRPTTVRHG